MAAPAPGALAQQQQPNEFDLARKRAQQQSNAAVQQQRDAIKRRAAAQGGLNSGAFIKQEQQAMQQGQEQLGQANEQIDTAQRAEARRIKEIEEQRNFQKGEREAAQKFAAAESALARGMQADQFAKTFGLSKEQFEAQKTQNEWQKKFAEAQAKGQNIDGTDNWMAQQAKKEYDEAQKVNQITTLLSAKNSGLNEGAIKALLDFYANGTPIPAGWPNIQNPNPASLTPATAPGSNQNTGYNTGGTTYGNTNSWRPGGAG